MKIGELIERIKNIFCKKDTKLLTAEPTINNSTNNEDIQTTVNTESVVAKTVFKESIEIKQNTEEAQLLKLQERLEAGEIEEEELTEEQTQKLHVLYDEQIEELRTKIERTKKETRAMLDKMKKTS
ncbi:MAG: hypothetical protein FWC68_02505 [Oscillospiraceae bacterium]|nr:hypothetical protein [Oscillospiraceae bacterium]